MSDVRVLDDAPWLKSGPTARVLALLNGNGEEARVVGGAVRNALLKIPTGDIDIATTALPAEVIRRAKAAGIKSVPTGIEHGTVTLVVDAQPFEVTTLREDTETFGRKAKVAFGRDWVGDAERRDFTINGLSVDADGVVHDHVGGLEDIARKACALHRRSEAAYRRRLSAHPQVFPHSRRLWRGRARSRRIPRLHPRARGLATLSAERVRMEMLKLMIAQGAAGAVTAMADGGLLLPIFGGVAYTGPFAAMISAERLLGPEPNAIRRLGALAVAVTEDAKARDSPATRQCRNQDAQFDGPSLVAARRHGRGDGAAAALSARRGSLPRPADAGLGAGGADADPARGANSPPCRSAGTRRNFRSRPPISSRAELPKARRSAMCWRWPKTPGLRRIFLWSKPTLKAIADQTVTRFTRDHRL